MIPSILYDEIAEPCKEERRAPSAHVIAHVQPPLEDTHNDGRDDNNNDDYDDVKALLTPKNFDEANAKVLPRRRTRGGQLRLSTSPPHRPPRPRHASCRAPCMKEEA